VDVDRGRTWRWATRYALRRAAAFVGDCETIRGQAVRHGMDPEKIVTFPWGANIRKYQPTGPKARAGNRIRARRGWGENEFVILSTRSWSPLYGVEDLVRAFIGAANRAPELRLLMLAGGPLSRRIKSMVHNAGLIDRVHFPGQINQNDLADYYRAADLYVSTSHSDGTSISLLEALASGLPVLVTDIPGNREWIAPRAAPDQPVNEAGWLFRPGDHVDLERRILEIVERREDLEAIGANARRLAEVRGDWDKNFPHLLRAWDIARDR
jgi:glycosyltransferase involved in cell wall biosynthesis